MQSTAHSITNAQDQHGVQSLDDMVDEEMPTGMVIGLTGADGRSLNDFARALQRELVRRGYLCARLVQTDEPIAAVAAALAAQGFVVLIETSSASCRAPNHYPLDLSSNPEQRWAEVLYAVARRCA